MNMQKHIPKQSGTLIIEILTNRNKKNYTSSLDIDKVSTRAESCLTLFNFLNYAGTLNKLTLFLLQYQVLHVLYFNKLVY